MINCFVLFLFSNSFFLLLFVVYVSPILHTCAHIVSDSLLSFLMSLSLSVMIVHVVCCGGAIFSFSSVFFLSLSLSVCFLCLLFFMYVSVCMCVICFSVFLC